MFLGEYSHALDSKKRIFMPAKYREELGETFVITKSVDKCLTVYTLPEWEKLKAKLDSLPATKSRQIKRFIFSNADDAHCDAQGRVLIPAKLRSKIGLTRDIVFVGLNAYIEVWDAEVYAKMEAQTEDEFDNIADYVYQKYPF